MNKKLQIPLALTIGLGLVTLAMVCPSAVIWGASIALGFWLLNQATRPLDTLFLEARARRAMRQDQVAAAAATD